MSRFAITTHFDPSSRTPNTAKTKYGCFYDGADQFDALLFRMSPRQAEQTDPIQRLILMSTYEALEQAGYSYESPGAHKVATFIGQSSDDWREVNAAQNIDTFYIPGGIRAFVSGRLNYHFGFEGPSFSIDTACSSSAASIDLACSALLSNKCDAAVAGGGNIMTAPDIFAGLSRGGFLSPTGPCKTWDESADGYCRGDAVGVVVMKRLKDAVANRDNILAVLESTLTNHSPQASSITHPHTQTQAKLMRTVLSEARVRPDQVDYVEMHGTGTQAGDVAETRAVQTVFGGHRTPDRPLHIGTAKPNVGHGEAASGVTSVIKAVLMLQKFSMPPHIGIKTVMNKKLPDLSGSEILIPTAETSFAAHPLAGGKRHILVNNFNATSGNTSLLLSDGFEPTSEGKDPRTPHIIAVSAHSFAALRGNLDRFERYLASNPHLDMPSLSYSTTARRMHHSLRQAYVANDVPRLLAAVKEDLVKLSPSIPSSQAGSIIFVFTGQASHYAGMGRRLFETSTAFRGNILRSEKICQGLGLPSFLGIITDSANDLADLDSVRSQLALVALEVALAELWRSWGIEPTAVIGHSIGEYAALFIAGVFSLADMFYLVGKRVQLLQKTCAAGTHSMLSVRMTIDDLELTLPRLDCQGCEIACHNALQSNVVSGPVDQIKRLESIFEQKRVKASLLQLPYAFHSAQMAPIQDEFMAVAREIPFRKPRISVASTVTGAIIQEEGLIGAQYFVQHMRQPVKFFEAVRELELQTVADTKTLWIEVGPGSVCTSLIKSILATTAERSLPSLAHGDDEWATIATSLAKAYRAGQTIKWREYHREYETSLKLLSLPTYAFDLKKYWIQYKGDWCVHKGKALPAAPSTPKSPGLESTTLQQIDSEKVGVDEAFVTFASDLKEERLYAAVTGHMVNNSALCPSSIYADMALTAASYIWKRVWPTKTSPIFDISHMNVRKPLIVKNDAVSQVIKIYARKEPGTDNIKMKVISPDAIDITHYADWIVSPGDCNCWMQMWAKQAYLYQSRIDCLKHLSSAGQVHHLLGSMVYKLFSVLVNYGSRYQGIQEAYMDGKLSEATARVLLQSKSKEDMFTCSPYWIDCLAHISGFVLNGSDTTPEDTVFISHGWESMRFAKALSENVGYTTYVKMQPTGEKGVMAGDVQIFQDDAIVAVIAGLRFQAIKKKLLSNILPNAGAQYSTEHRIAAPPPQTTGDPSRGRHPPSWQMDTTSNMSAATALIAAQLGVDSAILGDDAILADLGVDSLLIIEIQAQFRNELKIDVPSSYFVKPSTMRDLKRYFEHSQIKCPMKGEPGNKSSDKDRDPQSNTLTNSSPMEMNQGFSREWNAYELRKIIAEELEIQASEIEPQTKLLDLGVDSMLTISIINAVRSSIGQSIPADFFISYPTLSDIEAFFETKAKASSLTATPAVPQGRTEIKSSLHRKPSQSRNEKASTSQVAQRPTPKAPAIRCSTTFLQFPQNMTPNSPTLILLPDGTGSPAPYTALPTLHPALCVLGLTSPFLPNPSAYTIPLSEVASIFSSTITQAISAGPLILGGLSIGGVFAHEVAKQLLEHGREIKGLLFLDSPCPQTIPAIKPDLLLHILDALEQLGTFKRPGRPDPKLRPNVREHFVRNAVALEQHKPPLPSAAAREIPCEAVWATRGVLDSLSEAEGKKVEEAFQGESLARDWLLKRRETTGPQGWEEVFEDVRCQGIDANHFSLFKEEHVSHDCRRCLLGGMLIDERLPIWRVS